MKNDTDGMDQYLRMCYTSGKWEYMFIRVFLILSVIFTTGFSIIILSMMGSQMIEISLIVYCLVFFYIGSILFKPLLYYVENSKWFQERYDEQFQTRYSHLINKD